MYRKGILAGLLLASGAVLAAGYGSDTGASGSAATGAAGQSDLSADPGAGYGTGAGVGADADIGADLSRDQVSRFNTIDVDTDGLISQEEAAGSPQLVDNWAQFDQDESGSLDMGEFAAFEQELGADDSGLGGDAGLGTDDSGLGGDTGLGTDDSGLDQGGM